MMTIKFVEELGDDQEEKMRADLIRYCTSF